MNLNSLAAGLLLIGAGLALGELSAPPPRRPPRPEIMVDPNDPEKMRPIIPREEREALGLTPKTWAGVIKPDVYPTLETRERTLASLKEREKRNKDTRAFQLWFAGNQTRGTVYVQVQLKSKEAQRPVLARLKASEFYARLIFEEAPGFVGYATKEALDKLAQEPDVTGVCVDDKPMPEGPARTVYRHELPPPKPGDTSGEQPGVKEEKVQAEVYRAFEQTDRVDVWIGLRPDSLPKPESLPSDLHAMNEVIDRANRQLQDRVLSTVSADDFLLKSRFSSGMSGFVTKEGLEKLWKHSDVLRIRLQQLVEFK